MWRRMIVSAIMMLVLSIAVVQPSLAQSASWNAEFFNNTYLLGDAVATRTDGAIAFDWGNAAPHPGVNTDGFSVRWGADPYFTAGTYRFYALADDNVKVNVGFSYAPQIDTFSSLAIGQVVSADVTLTEGVHHVQVDYREVSGSAYVYVTWVNLTANPNAGPNFPVPQQSYSSLNNGNWTAQYYSNAGLTGTPVLSRGEAFPSYNWGTGSPDSSVPSDNFSARWTSVQTLDASSYTLTVRADDGVRVTVDGITYINEWHLANNNTYTATFNLTAGSHNFLIEYYEASGNAFLDYRLARTGVNQPAPSTNPGANTGSAATITTSRLNVRNAPNTGGTIIAKVNQGEVYPVVGANADQSWWQINVNGTVGWVFGRFVTIGGNTNVPVTNSTTAFAAPASTGFTVTALDTVNIRSIPNTRGSTVLSKLQRGGLAQVVGRNANSSWWQVDYQGVVGWVSARYAQLQSGVALSSIPVTG